ncbi:MAG: polysaccharide biosynthesis protein [Acidimicrobiales bacterium]|nr:polysaccharide biosynthesis protein [Acidimicrobiales bacterium]
MTDPTAPPLPDPAVPSPTPQDPAIGRRWRATTLPYLVLRGGGQAAEFVGWLVLARRLGSTSFGELAVGVLVCRYGGLLADWGASIRGVRDVAGGRHAGTMRRLNRRRSVTTAVLAATYVAVTLGLGVARLTPLVVMLVGIGLNRDWIALGQEKGGRSAAPTALQGLLLAVLAFASTSDTLALAVAVSYGAGLVLSILLNPLPKGPPEEPDAVDEVDGWMLLAVISNQVLSSADTFLIAGLMSASAAGVYAAVYRLPNGWLALLVIIRGGLLPLATSLLRTDVAQFRALRRTSLRWGAISGGALLVLTPLFFFAIPVLYGDEYRSGRWPAVLLLVSTAMASVAAPLHHLLLAFGDDRPYAQYLTWAALANVALNLVLIPRLGLAGAGLATLAANVLLAGVLWRALQQRLVRLEGAPAQRLPRPP